MVALELGGESPMFWLRLGYAAGAVEAGGRAKRIGISSDSNSVSQLVMDTVRIGARCAGARVYNFGEQNLPIMREAVRFYKTDCGIYAAAGESGSVDVLLLDASGAAMPKTEAERLAHCAETPISLGISERGSEVELQEFKTHYMRNIINSVKSESFDSNICLTTQSETVSEIIERVLEELNSRLKPGAADKYAFKGEISGGGERLALFKQDGERLTDEQVLLIMIYVMLRDSDAGTFVLPSSVSESAEAAVLRLGGNVIRASDKRNEIMRKILECGSGEQLLMQFDGVYAAVRIFDFLNRFSISLSELCDRLPRIFKAECEIECTDGGVLLDALKGGSGEPGSVDGGVGVKYKTQGGVTVIVKTADGHRLKIISEAESMEAAEELTAIFKNKIKTLANS